MTDDNGNERAIKKVVKKSVSDVFGEEEKPPEPPYTYKRYDYDDQAWKRDNPGFAFQRAGQGVKTSATAAAWGKPRDRAMRAEYDDAGNPAGINFTDEGWKALRRKVLHGVLKEFDWERLVLMPDDHVIIEQVIDTVMRRAKFQLGREGTSYHYGTLVQVPITIGDDPPAKSAVLPASSIDLKDDGSGWGTPDEDEVIDVSNPGDDNDNQ